MHIWLIENKKPFCSLSSKILEVGDRFNWNKSESQLVKTKRCRNQAPNTMQFKTTRRFLKQLTTRQSKFEPNKQIMGNFSQNTTMDVSSAQFQSSSAGII